MNNTNGIGNLALAERWCPHQEVLDWAQARIDELIGLTEAKEHFTIWRTALETGHGGTVGENHLVFLGAPGTAKKTFARVISEVLFGWDMITRPEVTVVSAHDITADSPSGSAAKIKETCARARGGVLFIDEAHQLAPDTENPSLGIEAIYALLTCMAAYRNELVVIMAGYPRPMQDFLTVRTGRSIPLHHELHQLHPRRSRRHWAPLRRQRTPRGTRRGLGSLA